MNPYTFEASSHSLPIFHIETVQHLTKPLYLHLSPLTCIYCWGRSVWPTFLLLNKLFFTVDFLAFPAFVSLISQAGVVEYGFALSTYFFFFLRYILLTSPTTLCHLFTP